MRFTFKKTERLFGHNTLENVYTNGKSFYNPHFKVIFIEVPYTEQTPCRVAFSVPKRSFKKAVDRNFIKRRMREVYRNNKESLYNHLTEKQKSVHVFFIYTPKKIVLFDELKVGLLQSLQTLMSKIN